MEVIFRPIVLDIIQEESFEIGQNEGKWEEEKNMGEVDENEVLVYDNDEESESESNEEDMDNKYGARAEDDRDDFMRYKFKNEGMMQKEAAARQETKEHELKELRGADWKSDRKDSIDTIITIEEEEWGEHSGSVSTTSYPCLKDINISDSQLKILNLLNVYPIPEDPGLVPAFWVLYPPLPKYKEDGIQKFSDLMKMLGLRPIRCVAEMLRIDKLDLRYYGVDPKAVRAICEATYNNTSVQMIDFKDNWLTRDACFHINNMLSENSILSSLSLCGCLIGPKGAEMLVEGLSTTQSLVDLDLSHCALEDEGLNFLAPAIQINQVLRNLNLADNHLGTNSTKALQMMITKNDSLSRLDLSWNALFTKDAAKCIFKGLLRNKSLTHINMAWNALGKDCLSSLAVFIVRNRIVLHLNLSGNRFTDDGGVTIAKALSKNVGLRELFIGNNPLKPLGALALVQAVTPERSPNSRMQYLDLENVWAKRDVLPELEKIKNDRPWLSVNVGGILSNYQLIGPDPRKIFLKRANYEAMMPKRKKQRKNFGHFVLTLEDNLITKEKFKELIGKFKLKLSDSLIQEIMKAFVGPQKKVDQAALKSFYLDQYQDTIPPISEQQKKKRRKNVSNDTKKSKNRVKKHGKEELKSRDTAKGRVKKENGRDKNGLKEKATVSTTGGEEYESEEGEYIKYIGVK